MSFNEEELKKIEQATTASSKQSARNAIAQAISEIRPKIENAKKLSEKQKKETLKKLVNKATAARHKALKDGANSYGHAKWAAAATCESWLHELLSGTSESITRIENLINKLEERSTVANNKNSYQKNISIEFFDFSEEAFEISHEIVSLREDINKNSGTFLSVIKNLFREVDYNDYLLRAKDLNQRIKDLKSNIHTFLDPANENEKKFIQVLNNHINDIEDISKVLITKYQFMVKKAESASTSNTSWGDWKKVVEKEENLLNKCQTSGDALTNVYYQFQRR